jgi:hypothetical protein
LFEASLANDAFEEGKHQPYTAIFYACGDPNATASFECDGQKVTLNRNAFIALVQALYRQERAIVWIDAVCIDQTKNDEKGHQIAMMSRIYCSAEHVIISSRIQL